MSPVRIPAIIRLAIPMFVLWTGAVAEAQVVPPPVIRCGKLVTTNAATGPGSLRDAIANPPMLGPICFDAALFNRNVPVANRTIALATPIAVTRNVWVSGPGGDLVIVSGQKSSQVFSVGAIRASLAGITIKDGLATNGGGIYNDGGVLYLASVHFIGNGANTGGAIYSAGGEVTIRASTFSSNWANGTSQTGNGGAIYAYTSTVLDVGGSLFKNNSATAGGGAISAVEVDDFSIYASTIDTNWARVGAGVSVRPGGDVTIDASEIIGNGASGSGGGLYVIDNGVNTVLLNDTSMTYNYAYGNGGGVMIDRGIGRPSTELALGGTSVISNNFASNGGGIYASRATLTNAIAGTNVLANSPNDIVP